jgi:hypothetical protein
VHIDLLKLTAVLVDVPSVSGNEAALADHVESMLRSIPGLSVDRVAESVVARTQLGRPHRLVLAGHLDTVPANGNERARIEGDTLWGLGACDMKGGDAVLLALAQTVPEPAVDLSFVSRPSGTSSGGWSPSDPTWSSVTPPSWPSRPAPLSKPAARGRYDCASPSPGFGPTAPGRGWGATPSTGWGACSNWSTATRAGVR